MRSSVVHHVEVCARERKLAYHLTKGCGFHPIARRLTPSACQYAFRSGSTIFVITNRHTQTLNQQVAGSASGNAAAACSNIDQHNLEKINGLQQNDQETQLSFPDIRECGCSFERTSSKTHNSSSTEKSPNLTQTTFNTQIKSEKTLNDYEEHWTVFCCRAKADHTIDSVFNVALVVKDVDQVTERVRSQGGQVIREPADISDAFGQVRYSIVTSCCGNIVHTLIDKSNYKGDFLPGFEAIQKFQDYAEEDNNDNISSINNSHFQSAVQETNILNGAFEMQKDTQGVSSDTNIYNPGHNPPLSTHIDHVTYVCEAGKSQNLIEWYERCFGMKRFKINLKESTEEGFVLGDNIGLRLKAMEYWRCAETGLTTPEAATGDSSLKLVIGEPLPNISESHVNTFLQEHKGAGIQHIALYTPTITATVKYMSDNGVTFRKPPPVYYEEGIKLEEIEEAGYGKEINDFKALGILLDTEADESNDFGNTETREKKRHLMQVFTTPIFKEDTFFLEVIQRCGATGFGAGNITALARSIILYKQQQESS
ncbi:hypothetical protein OTU49_012026 [Cherax quadricarinatus]|uniref:VOC domain-containing protein n=2 Tax=Cherax quadricarinatus TaxID=27406 RepID=A0AAW0W043_CHEQU